MTDIPKYLEDSQEELDKYVEMLEKDFFNEYFYEFLSDFRSDEDGIIDLTEHNYSVVNSIGTVFDDARDSLFDAFLIWFGYKIITGAKMNVSYFRSIGVNTRWSEVDFIERQIGLYKGKIVKGSYLHNLGYMGEVRQQIQQYIINSMSQGARLNRMLRDIKPLITSTKNQRSLFSKYYMKYAYNAISHAINSVGKWIADKNGLDKFLYDGGIIKDSREFCRQRAGQIYTRDEGNEWNDMEWRGKMPDLDFFVQVGGYNCLHHIKWLNE